MSYSEFERVNSSLPEDVEHYKNPRNLANSTINLTAEKEMEHREIWFHAFKLVHSGGNYLPEKPRTFFNDMEFLKLLGFETTEHILCSVSDLIAECIQFV